MREIAGRAQWRGAAGRLSGGSCRHLKTTGVYAAYAVYAADAIYAA
jgi:hypothetical protein